MVAKKGLGEVSPPNYGTICILYPTPTGWVYGTAETAESGVTFRDSEGAVIEEPKPWTPCADPKECPDAMRICGPIEIAGLGALLNAVTKDCVLSCGADGFIHVNGVPSTVPCPVPTNTVSINEDGNIVVTSPDGTDRVIEVTSAGPLTAQTDANGDPTGFFEQEVLDANGDPTGEVIISDLTSLISAPQSPDTDTRTELTVAADGSVTKQVIDVATNQPIGPAEPLVDAPLSHITVNEPNNPLKITLTGNSYEHDLDLAGTQDTSFAPDNNYRAMVQCSDGQWRTLRSDDGWIENHDGTVSMAWQAILPVSEEYYPILLPTSVPNPEDLVITVTDRFGGFGIVEAGDAIGNGASSGNYDVHVNAAGTHLLIAETFSANIGISNPSDRISIQVERGKL